MYSENSISKKFKTFAEKNEWLISGEYIYGDEQGYLFSGLDGQGEKIFLTPVPGITEDQQSELFAALDKNKGTLKLTKYAVTDDFLCVRIKDTAKLNSDELEFILALLVGTLQDLDIVTVGRCQECGKMDADNEDFMFDLYCYMHKECAEKFKTENETKTDRESDDEETVDSDEVKEDDEAEVEKEKIAEDLTDDVKTSKKVLFTLAGAAIGSIPWLLLPYILGYVDTWIDSITKITLVSNLVQSLFTCVCAYLVSYMAILGYRMAKGRMNRKGRWIVGIVSITVVILIQFAYIAVLIIKEPTVALTWSNYITNISKSTLYINLLLGVLIGTVFALISVLPFFDTSISSSKKAKKIAAKKAAEEIDDDTDAETSDEESAVDDAQKKD
jgi:hypothetical protein